MINNNKNKFSVFLLTYNRHNLLELCIQSLRQQIYSDYEVFVVDNGSEPPVCLDFSDDRYKLIRYDKNTNGCIVGEEILNKITGNYFVFLADDDAFIPSTLSIVNEVLTFTPSAEIVQTGLAYFKHTTGVVDTRYSGFNDFTGEVREYESVALGYHFCSGWGIGKKTETPAPRMSHSSGHFLSVELIQRTRRVQKELFIRPFGDIGYVGALFNTERAYFVDLPLVIIGETAEREMLGSLPGNRLKWIEEVPLLEYVPLKTCSFINMGAEGHLRVLYRNNKHIDYDCRLRPDFYCRHLKQVISDRPCTWLTIKDIVESILPLIISMINYVTVQDIVSKMILLLKATLKRMFILKNITSNADSVPDAIFHDIYCFAEWIEKNCSTEVVSQSLVKKSGFAHDKTTPL